MIFRVTACCSLLAAYSLLLTAHRPNLNHSIANRKCQHRTAAARSSAHRTRPNARAVPRLKAWKCAPDLAGAHDLSIDITAEPRHQVNAEVAARQLYLSSQTVPGPRRNRKVHCSLLNDNENVAASKRQIGDAFQRVDPNRAFDPREFDWATTCVDRQIAHRWHLDVVINLPRQAN